MRRITIAIVFAMAALMSLSLTPSIMARVNQDIISVTNCTYNNTGIKCGNYYINQSNSADVLTFGQSITIECNDIDKLIYLLDAEIIDTNVIDQDNTLYVLYSDNLPKYRIINNQKYNLQICVNNNTAKIGYPAIYDSF